jgi:hypothetical protein
VEGGGTPISDALRYLYGSVRVGERGGPSWNEEIEREELGGGSHR